jgi:hypothetical protein
MSANPPAGILELRSTMIRQHDSETPYEYTAVGLDASRGLVDIPDRVQTGLVIAESQVTYRTRRRYRKVERTAHLLDVPSVQVVETGRSVRALGWGVMFLLAGIVLTVAGSAKFLTRGISELISDLMADAPFAGTEMTLIIAQFEEAAVVLGLASFALGFLAFTYFAISGRVTLDANVNGEQVSLPLSRAHVEAARMFSRFCVRRRSELLNGLA